MLYSPVKRLRIAHSQSECPEIQQQTQFPVEWCGCKEVLGQLGSLEGITSDDIAVQVDLKNQKRPRSLSTTPDPPRPQKRKKITLTIPLDLSDVEPANDPATIHLHLPRYTM